MKRVLVLAAVVLLISGTGFAQITGSAHDFSADGYGTTQICQPCHTPHNADQTVTDSPLWNHEVTSTAVFTIYDTPTMDATTGQPDGASKLCLSCHDGTVALENFGGVTTGTTMIGSVGTGSGDFGIDLSNDHPISFTYNTALANTDGGLFDPSSDTTSIGGTIANDLLFADSMECASCHDVHNNGNSNLLMIGNNASALCLTCHDK